MDQFQLARERAEKRQAKRLEYEAQKAPQERAEQIPADEITVIAKIRGQEYWLNFDAPDISSGIMASDFNQDHINGLFLKLLQHRFGRVTSK